jgi:alpha-1,3-rhamnosyl/mannosyltransferase
MRVAVNMTWCVPGAVGGSEEYLVRQILGLDTTEIEPTLFVPRGFSDAHPELRDRCVMVEADNDGTSRVRRILDESSWLFRRTEGFSLVHHGGGTIPTIHRSPALLTIHDLQYRAFPEYFSRKKLTYLRAVMPMSARRASAIAVPTEFVKSTVCESYGVPDERVHVVPHGVEPRLGEGATPENELREKFALGDSPFVVFPAMTHPHKGHAFLLDVMERHWAARGVRLVLIGGRGTAEADIARRLLSESLSASVSRLGRVSAADRDGLIRAAIALVFPSEYEGFGAPLIEAMALGTPVLCSDRACLPEVVGSAGLVRELVVDEWGSAIDTLAARRSELIRAGRERVDDFTAATSGAALGRAYRSIVR